MENVPMGYGLQADKNGRIRSHLGIMGSISSAFILHLLIVENLRDLMQLCL